MGVSGTLVADARGRRSTMNARRLYAPGESTPTRMAYRAASPASGPNP